MAKLLEDPAESSTEEVKMSGKRKRRDTAENRLYRTGSLSMALEVLRKHRKEMHPEEIAEHIFREFNVKVNKGSLGTQLWRHINRHHDSPFYKSKRAKSMYGLKERQLTTTTAR
jgi:hypothetical protein